MIKDKIIEILKTVIDPELGVDIYTLGLILNVEVGEYYQEIYTYEYIKIIMTLTTPMCPFANYIIDDVKNSISAKIKAEVLVELNFEQEWVCPPEIRLGLGL